MTAAGADLGVNLGRYSDLRVGGQLGWVSARARVGDPNLPSASGAATQVHAAWRLDTQDSPVVPSRGTSAYAAWTFVYDDPEVFVNGAETGTARSSTNLPQLSGEASHFWSRDRNRIFVLGGGGTSFDHHPLPIDQFTLGRPLHLAAYSNGQLRGDHYLIATAGYLRTVGRLPDFIGGPIFAGGWVENGDAFNHWSDATWRTHVSGGLILDTLLGPVVLAGSTGFDGRFRAYLAIGRLLR